MEKIATPYLILSYVQLLLIVKLIAILKEKVVDRLPSTGSYMFNGNILTFCCAFKFI